MKYTLITGATSGIGLELASIYAQQAKNLILVARSEDILKRMAEDWTNQYGIMVHYFVADLSKMEDAKELVYWTRTNGYEVETLINNAGFGSFGEFHKSNLKTEWEMLQLNVVSLMYLTRAFLPGMVFRGQGGVLNVASVAAFVPGPRMANYYASKAYVLSFTEALAAELKKTKIKISALCPGPVRTNFQARSKMQLKKRLINTEKHSLSAVEVARYAYDRFQAGEVVIVPGREMKWITMLSRILPKTIVRWLMSIFQ